jgi:hypothetical protein
MENEEGEEPAVPAEGGEEEEEAVTAPSRWVCDACGCHTNAASDRTCTICGTHPSGTLALEWNLYEKERSERCLAELESRLLARLHRERLSFARMPRLSLFEIL